MLCIRSLDNPAVKRAVSLHEKRGRRKEQLFIVEGMRSVQTFFEAGWRPEQLYMTPAVYETLVSPLTPVPIIPSALVTPAVMEKMSTCATPPGLLALFAIPPIDLEQPLSPGLVAAELGTGGNLGTLVRTAAAFALPTVVTVGGVDPWSPKVVQAAAGALAYTTLLALTWQELLIRKGDLSLCALVAQGGTPLEAADLSQALFVVGNEAHGLPAAWTASCDQRLTIAMPGYTESFNAAVAGSIALYARYCQQAMAGATTIGSDSNRTG